MCANPTPNCRASTPSLEQQALGPITAESEMRGGAYDATHILPEVVARLWAIPAYVARFERAFGPGAVTAGRVGGAIAGFERSLVTTDSSFDRSPDPALRAVRAPHWGLSQMPLRATPDGM